MDDYRPHHIHPDYLLHEWQSAILEDLERASWPAIDESKPRAVGCEHVIAHVTANGRCLDGRCGRCWSGGHW